MTEEHLLVKTSVKGDPSVFHIVLQEPLTSDSDIQLALLEIVLPSSIKMINSEDYISISFPGTENIDYEEFEFNLENYFPDLVGFFARSKVNQRDFLGDLFSDRITQQLAEFFHIELSDSQNILRGVRTFVENLDDIKQRPNNRENIFLPAQFENMKKAGFKSRVYNSKFDSYFCKLLGGLLAQEATPAVWKRLYESIFDNDLESLLSILKMSAYQLLEKLDPVLTFYHKQLDNFDATSPFLTNTKSNDALLYFYKNSLPIQIRNYFPVINQFLISEKLTQKEFLAELYFPWTLEKKLKDAELVNALRIFIDRCFEIFRLKQEIELNRDLLKGLSAERIWPPNYVETFSSKYADEKWFKDLSIELQRQSNDLWLDLYRSIFENKTAQYRLKLSMSMSQFLSFLDPIISRFRIQALSFDPETISLVKKGSPPDTSTASSDISFYYSRDFPLRLANYFPWIAEYMSRNRNVRNQRVFIRSLETLQVSSDKKSSLKRFINRVRIMQQRTSSQPEDIWERDDTMIGFSGQSDISDFAFNTFASRLNYPGSTMRHVDWKSLYEAIFINNTYRYQTYLNKYGLDFFLEIDQLLTQFHVLRPRLEPNFRRPAEAERRVAVEAPSEEPNNIFHDFVNTDFPIALKYLFPWVNVYLQTKNITQKAFIGELANSSDTLRSVLGISSSERQTRVGGLQLLFTRVKEMGLKSEQVVEELWSHNIVPRRYGFEPRRDLRPFHFEAFQKRNLNQPEASPFRNVTWHELHSAIFQNDTAHFQTFLKMKGLQFFLRVFAILQSFYDLIHIFEASSRPRRHLPGEVHWNKTKYEIALWQKEQHGESLFIDHVKQSFSKLNEEAKIQTTVTFDERSRKIQFDVAPTELVILHNRIADIYSLPNYLWGGKSYKSRYCVDHTIDNRTLYIYSDISREVILGESKFSVIQTLAYNAEGGTCHKSFQPPLYLKLKTNYLSEVNIYIYNELGSKVRFNEQEFSFIKLGVKL